MQRQGTNIDENTTTLFESIRGAAKELGTNHKNLIGCLKDNRLFNNKYRIIKKNP